MSLIRENWQREWDGLVDLVGKPSPEPVRWAVDRVERGAIRRYLEPLEFDCPLHYDTAVAQKHGYADVVAPYTSVLSWGGQGHWKPGQQLYTSSDRNFSPPVAALPRTGVPERATEVFATDLGIEFARPLAVGDRVGGAGQVLTGVALKETRVGRGAFIKYSSEILDENESVVANTHLGLFIYEPHPIGGADAGVSAPTRHAPAEWTEGPWVKVVDEQRCGEDVVVGEVLEALEFPLSVFRLVMAAGANRDFNSVHHNSEAARQGGAPEMYANSIFLQSMWEKLARSYIGCAGRIRSISGFRMGSFNVAGDSVVVRGRVESCVHEDERTVVGLRVWSENALGVSVGPGTVTVDLPRRRAGV